MPYRAHSDAEARRIEPTPQKRATCLARPSAPRFRGEVIPASMNRAAMICCSAWRFLLMARGQSKRQGSCLCQTGTILRQARRVWIEFRFFRGGRLIPVIATRQILPLLCISAVHGRGKRPACVASERRHASALPFASRCDCSAAAGFEWSFAAAGSCTRCRFSFKPSHAACPRIL